MENQAATRLLSPHTESLRIEESHKVKISSESSIASVASTTPTAKMSEEYKDDTVSLPTSPGSSLANSVQSIKRPEKLEKSLVEEGGDVKLVEDLVKFMASLKTVAEQTSPIRPSFISRRSVEDARPRKIDQTLAGPEQYTDEPRELETQVEKIVVDISRPHALPSQPPLPPSIPKPSRGTSLSRPEFQSSVDKPWKPRKSIRRSLSQFFCMSTNPYNDEDDYQPRRQPASSMTRTTGPAKPRGRRNDGALLDSLHRAL
ncbi:hypothetical protein P280DRAFT_474257 [Massarina eburnea CBS 473.64]|uniref:Uncharacterized protein n=1 Tax=Massarina eburnea CBS 473.64 TaxID=1395130 RepID=A0A6A6RLP3_9PLEO|nr:hypothetical protein P280DRAFT_474257 [Massarina eburnea CBS 473.64]